jgi:hypothetical protein
MYEGEITMEKEDRKQMIAACLKSKKIRKMYDDYVIKEKITFKRWVTNNVDYLLNVPKPPPEKLTIGMRCRIKKSSHWYRESAPNENEVLLQERSSHGSFSFMRLGQKELKMKDPQTVVGGGAWIDEDEMVFVNANLDENLKFMDWYQEHEDDFCDDCGAWHPENIRENPDLPLEKTLCPNKKCPGRKLDTGHCPHCHPDVKLNKNDKCPECGFEE